MHFLQACDPILHFVFLYLERKINCGKRRKRRSFEENVIELPDDADAFNYFYNPDDGPIVVPSFPTPSGITKIKAQTECGYALINSTAGRACLKKIRGFNISNFFDQCVVDTQV